MPSTPPRLPIPALHARMPQYLARRFWQVAATLQSEALAPFGLVPWQGALLAQLRATPGQDRNWLAAAIGIDATSAGKALADFEARGLVARGLNAEDRRAGAFTLTEAGQALAAEVAAPVRAVAQRLLAPLDPADATKLLELLVRLVDAHEVHARPGAGRRPPRRKTAKAPSP